MREEIERLGQQRQGVHDRTCTSPRYYPHNRAHENTVGGAVELAFEKQYGYPKDEWHDHDGGDQGWDFTTPAGRIDVKGVRKRPWCLPVKVKQIHKGAEIYVLGRVDDDGNVTWVGWQTQVAMLERNRQEMIGFDMNYVIEVEHLRPMEELERMMRGES